MKHPMQNSMSLSREQVAFLTASTVVYNDRKLVFLTTNHFSICLFFDILLLPASFIICMQKCGKNFRYVKKMKGAEMGVTFPMTTVTGHNCYYRV